MKGRVAIGYRLFNDIIYGKVLEKQGVFNDYACMTNKCSEFIFKSFGTVVTAFAIRKDNFRKLLESEPVGPNFS